MDLLSRYARQLEVGLIDAKWPLSPRPGDVKPWTELNAGEQDDQDLKMATYAAMIDRLDQNIGRLMAKLKQMEADRSELNNLAASEPVRVKELSTVWESIHQRFGKKHASRQKKAGKQSVR